MITFPFLDLLKRSFIFVLQILTDSSNIEYVQFETKTKQIKQSETPVDEMVMGEKRIHLGYIRILS